MACICKQKIALLVCLNCGRRANVSYERGQDILTVVAEKGMICRKCKQAQWEVKQQ